MRKILIETVVMSHNSSDNFISTQRILEALDGFELNLDVYPSDYQDSKQVTLKFTEVRSK